MKKIVYIAVITALLAGTSCSKLTRTLKNPSIDEKYQAALAYYEAGDYYRAGLVFEDLLPNMMGRAEAEFVQFYYAHTHFQQKQYEMASHYFKSFHDTYRRSDFAEEALYMHALAMYQNTPEFNLDQSNTENTIEAMQDFLNRYPQSAFGDKASEYIRVLRRKLELKAYNIAKQYERLGMHKAAVVAFENFQRDFPDSDFKEEVSFLKIQAQYELARVSVESMKKERYEKTIEYYYSFVDRYPQTKYGKNAENIFNSSQRQLLSLSSKTVQ
jgi:outer membrane protein assembly factor BamD